MMESQEKYLRSPGEMMHRCFDCWKSLCTFDGKGWTAFDNGYVLISRDYPHAEWCKQRGKF